MKTSLDIADFIEWLREQVNVRGGLELDAHSTKHLFVILENVSGVVSDLNALGAFDDNGEQDEKH